MSQNLTPVGPFHTHTLPRTTTSADPSADPNAPTSDDTPPAPPVRRRGVKRREATDTERVEMHTLFHRGRWTMEKIAKELGFHPTTVGRIVKEPLSPRKTKNRGRHKLLSPPEVRRLIALATQDAYHRGISLVELARIAGIEVSERVIREAMQNAGYDRREPVESKPLRRERRGEERDEEEEEEEEDERGEEGGGEGDGEGGEGGRDRDREGERRD